jgi:hypothetical protein
MALEISYFDGAGTTSITSNVYGGLVASASVTLSGSSASCGTVPAGTRLARVKAGETCRVSNNGAAASATNGVHLAASETIDITISPGIVLNALTV